MFWVKLSLHIRTWIVFEVFDISTVVNKQANKTALRYRTRSIKKYKSSSRLTDRIFIWLSKCAKGIHYYCNKLLFFLKNIFWVSFYQVFVGPKYETGHLRWFLIWSKFHISALKLLKLKILVSTPHN